MGCPTLITRALGAYEFFPAVASSNLANFYNPLHHTKGRLAKVQSSYSLLWKVHSHTSLDTPVPTLDNFLITSLTMSGGDVSGTRLYLGGLPPNGMLVTHITLWP